MLRWDLFCSVVDNFGDVGVCWRLARQLAGEHRIALRLWIDDLTSAQRLIPSLDVDEDCQQVQGVDILRWTDGMPVVEPGDVVIAAFACALPDAFIEAMARRTTPPVWINLEYLSAEDWVAGGHGLPSPHPRLPLKQYFFFPGLHAGTGGLLREADYPARRAGFSADIFWTALALPPPAPRELRVSLFSYENAGLPELLDCWRRSPSPVTCLVPEGRILPGVAAACGSGELHAGDCLVRGALTVRVLPFVEQAAYDELLWACDLNFVRGEDSFVRAQWAEHPFVWHIYAQQDDAHLAKLEAFLLRYGEGLDAVTLRVVTDFWLAWNRGAGVAAAWPAFLAVLPVLAAHAPEWSARLLAAGDLAGNLVRFCKLAIK